MNSKKHIQVASLLLLAICTPALAQFDSLFGSSDQQKSEQMTEAEHAAASAAQAEAIAALEEVVVTGEKPGPALWQVRKGEHALWILGTVSLLPKDVTWNSKKLEQLMTQVAVLIPGSAEVNIGVFSMLLHPINLMHTVMLPDGKTLQQALSADSYAQFNRLRTQYAPDEKMLDKTRPVSALIMLQSKAAEHARGLKSADIVQSVLNMTEQHGIKTVKIKGPEIFYSDMKDAFAALQSMPVELEQRCFDLGLASFEHDLSVSKARATAWAIGDLEALQKLAYSGQNGDTCMDEYMNQAQRDNPKAFAKGEAKSKQMEDVWMQAAEEALNKYAVSLTLKPISALLDKQGLLQQFSNQGYEVISPQ